MKLLDNILGFRSRKPWKMIIAGLVYLNILVGMFDGLGGLLFCGTLLGAILSIGIISQKNQHKSALIRYTTYTGIIFIAFIAGSVLASQLDPDFGKANTPTTQTVENAKKPEIPSKNDPNQEKQEQQPKSSSQSEVPQQTQEVSSPVKLIAGTVTRVIDGDTAVIALTNGKEEKVRFIGVDTPESTTKHEPYGEEASSYTKAQLNSKKVYLELDVGERDKYGRLLAYIWLAPPTKMDDSEIQAKMFNAKLLQDGYAQIMTIQPNSKYADNFATCQREARDADKGLWAVATSTTSTSTSSNNYSSSPSTSISSPTVSTDEKSMTVYVTNTGSKYHRDGCRYLRKSKMPISLEDARASYDPCSVCNPPE